MLLWVYMIEQNRYNNDVLKLRAEYNAEKKVELTNTQKQEKIQKFTESISRKEEIINQTSLSIEKIRSALGMETSTEIPPSILNEQASLEKIKKEKAELEVTSNIQETNQKLETEHEPINENNPEYRKFFENESLELLKKHDLEYFNNNYSGVGEDGYLLDKEGNQTSSLPSQNIGGSLGGIKYSNIKESIDEKFKNRPVEESKAIESEVSKTIESEGEYEKRLMKSLINMTDGEFIKDFGEGATLDDRGYIVLADGTPTNVAPSMLDYNAEIRKNNGMSPDALRKAIQEEIEQEQLNPPIVEVVSKLENDPISTKEEIPEIIQEQVLEEITIQPEIEEKIVPTVESLNEQQKLEEVIENQVEDQTSEEEKHFESVKNEETIEEIRRFEGTMKTSLENISNSGAKLLDALNERQGMRLTPIQSEDDFHKMVSLFKSVSNIETKYDVATLENIKQGFQKLSTTFTDMEFQRQGGISENIDNLERLAYSLKTFAAVCEDVSRKLPVELSDKKLEDEVLQLKNTLQVVNEKSQEAWLKVIRRKDILG